MNLDDWLVKRRVIGGNGIRGDDILGCLDQRE